MASALTLAHIEAQRRLRQAVVRGVEGIWRGLPGYDRPNVDEWLSRVLPVVAAGQRQSALLTDAYLARSLERAPIGLNIERLSTVRGDTSPAEAYERPFITLWSSLSSGVAFTEAKSAALARAASMARWDVQATMRATAGAVQEADDGIFGFERVADASACAFCQEVDGAYVKSGDAMPLHNGCGCGLEPLTAPHRLAAKLPSGVAVHQHGEMGPVLVSPDHDFTTESDLL